MQGFCLLVCFYFVRVYFVVLVLGLDPGLTNNKQVLYHPIL